MRCRNVMPEVSLGFGMLLLLTDVVAQSSERLQFVDFPICIMTPLVQLSEAGGSPASFSSPSFVQRTKAALLAVKHVNERNCAVLGPGCEKLLAVGDDGIEIKIESYLVDLHGISAVLSQRAAQICLETNAQVFVGSTTSEQSSLITAFVSGLGRHLSHDTSTHDWICLLKSALIPHRS